MSDKGIEAAAEAIRPLFIIADTDDDRRVRIASAAVAAFLRAEAKAGFEKGMTTIPSWCRETADRLEADHA